MEARTNGKFATKAVKVGHGQVGCVLKKNKSSAFSILPGLCLFSPPHANTVTKFQLVSKPNSCTRSPLSVNFNTLNGSEIHHRNRCFA